MSDAERQPNVLDWNALDDGALASALKGERLGLTPTEYRRLVDLIGRDATGVEARIFDTMWSEHCSYKSSRPVLRRFPTEGSEVIIGPGEDAGVVYLGTHDGVRYCVVLAHESHNHPSQIMPVEGAATGVGGIVRDVFCMGAEVIGVLDALRFGDPSGAHAARVQNIVGGVVGGIMSYGNALGVPNLGGDVVFDATFDDNCLVNVVAVGVCPESRLVHSRVPESAIDGEEFDVILLGKPTDATGFGGAAFASAVLDSDSSDDRKEAVQVPDPFLKRVLFEATEEVFRLVESRGVEIGFKDLGAGGIACATVEIAASAGLGVEIDLDAVNVDHDAHPPEVIACAETQERFALAVPRSLSAEILAIYNQTFDLPSLYPGAGARVVGRVLAEDRYVLTHDGAVVCDLPASVITAGITVDRQATAVPPPAPTPTLPEFGVAESLIELVGSPNGASRAHVYRGYDTEVRGRAILRPGESDAGVLAAVPGAPFGLAMSVDGIPAYGRVDPFLAGVHAAYESMRNVVASGAEPIALTDCLNFGNPEDPGVFAGFVAAVDGISAAASGIGRLGAPGEAVPVVSGNVSFYNESTAGRAIAPSPIVACAGRLAALADATPLRVPSADCALVLVGRRGPELGASEIIRQLVPDAYGESVAGALPPVDFGVARSEMAVVLDLIRAGRVRACHDIGVGGLLVTVAEMLLGESSSSTLGAELDVSALHDGVLDANALAALWFGETPGFVMAIDENDRTEVTRCLEASGVAWWSIGRVQPTPRLALRGAGEPVTIDVRRLAEVHARGFAAAIA